MLLAVATFFILIAKLMSSGSKRTAQRKSTSNPKLIDSHSKMERRGCSSSLACFGSQIDQIV